jgi:hypothetical protein
MKKSILLSFFAFVLMQTSFAQVPQTVIVEHFTNTRCGICASRNPGLFTNLAANPKVLHIAVHPSRPYSSCLLYQHNPTENDARTNYYGILGGTPRIVINGTVMNGSFTGSTLFDTFKTKTSPLDVRIKHTNFAKDSIRATIVIKAVATHNLSSVQLYVPLVEDSLNYSAPNGESLHHNVFRKVFANEMIAAPANGDSVVLNYTLTGNASWNFNKLKALALVQDMNTKVLIQAAESATTVNNINNIKSISNLGYKVFPNPNHGNFSISANEEGVLLLYNMHGKKVGEYQINKTLTSNLSLNLGKGIYTAVFTSNQGSTQKQKLMILK